MWVRGRNTIPRLERAAELMRILCEPEASLSIAKIGNSQTRFFFIKLS
jgi:hypothetical protein